MAIEPDTKDWTWVMSRPCTDCGFDPSTVDRDEVGDRIASSADGWANILSGPDATQRPNDSTWSPLEYGCHIRDVHRIMAQRLELILTTEPAEFANWDQDETAVADGYRTQDPTVVAGEIADAAARFAAAYDAVADDQWDRRGLRSNGSSFTVDTFAVYALHDLEHHRVDVGLPARSPRP
jgi:hypothetical protein